MEVNQSNFWAQLLPMLRGISRASFVAIDLEMSGVAMKSRREVRERTTDSGKPDLQEWYEETKEAAETYQILQLGITCVEDDLDKSIYIAKPYNINVTPLFADGDKLGLHRDFTMSTSAIAFLKKNHFDVGKALDSGVFYMSRQEHLLAQDIDRQKKIRDASIPDIILSANDSEGQQFLDHARGTISTWVSSKKETGFVNVGRPGGLNGFLRRLVHQLVRNEFPGYRTFSRQNGHFMQVEQIDHAHEAKHAKSVIAAFQRNLSRQKGLGWLLEALTGNDLKGVEAMLASKDIDNNPSPADVAIIVKELETITTQLKNKKRLLVGHNLVTDLTFIYKTFFGPLPKNVSEFKKELHGLFPNILDTKYMWTQASGTSRSNSSLSEICEQLQKETVPSIYLGQGFEAYDAEAKFHEAGYDSWMTAQAFVKLTMKLLAARTAATDEVESSVSEEDMVYISADEEIDGDRASDEGVPLNPPDTDVAVSALASVHNDRVSFDSSPSSSKLATPSRFSTRNSFARLLDEADSSSPITSPYEIGSPGGAPLSGSPLKQRISVTTTTKENKATSEEDHLPSGYFAARLNPPRGADGKIVEPASRLMPRANDTFWEPYSNKLRVYGTDKEVFDLFDIDAM